LFEAAIKIKSSESKINHRTFNHDFNTKFWERKKW